MMHHQLVELQVIEINANSSSKQDHLPLLSIKEDIVSRVHLRHMTVAVVQSDPAQAATRSRTESAFKITRRTGHFAQNAIANIEQARHRLIANLCHTM